MITQLIIFVSIILVTNFIMKAFINGRRVFGTPVRGFPKEYPSKMVSVLGNSSQSICILFIDERK